MNRRGLAVALALAGVWLSAGGSAASAASYAESVQAILSSPPAGANYPEAVEASILNDLNKLRARKKLGILGNRPALQKAARAHSMRMLRDGFFAHEDPDGRDVGARIAAVDRTGLYRTVGENLGKITPVIPDVAVRMHKGWVESPGHYTNMINKDFDRVGIGCAQDAKQTLCTQAFGGLAAQLADPLPLVFSRGQRVELQPALQPLSYAGWHLVDFAGKKQSGGKTRQFQPPKGLRGEFQMEVLAEKRISKIRSIIYQFFGPTVILE